MHKTLSSKCWLSVLVPVDIRGSGRAVRYVKCLWWHIADRPPLLFTVFLGNPRDAVVKSSEAKICELEGTRAGSSQQNKEGTKVNAGKKKMAECFDNIIMKILCAFKTEFAKIACLQVIYLCTF